MLEIDRVQEKVRSCMSEVFSGNGCFCDKILPGLVRQYVERKAQLTPVINFVAGVFSFQTIHDQNLREIKGRESLKNTKHFSPELTHVSGNHPDLLEIGSVTDLVRLCCSGP